MSSALAASVSAHCYVLVGGKGNYCNCKGWAVLLLLVVGFVCLVGFSF